MKLDNRSSTINNSPLIITILLVFILNAGLFAESGFIVIKDPVPNLKEKNFIQLKKVGEIIDEIGKGVFLFYPFSMAMDDKNYLYVYDLMQAKILIFDPSFNYISSLGRVGNGPGEFRGTGKGYPVYLNFGLDGKLYAHDTQALKILVFDTERRKYLKDINYYRRFGIGNDFLKPVVDKDGNSIFYEFKDKNLVIFNANRKTLFSLPHGEKKKEILFIEMNYMPSPPGMTMNFPFKYNFDEFILNYTKRSELLLYFSLSSTLIVVHNNGRPKKFRIWPEQALNSSRGTNKNLKRGYAYMFFSVFIDSDSFDYLYLNRGRSETEANIYKVNFKGELVAVLIAPKIKQEKPLFRLKKNNLYFARSEEKILIYKE
jgi:hypothetical protein